MSDATLRLTVRDGPVSLSLTGASGVSGSLPLWAGIEASEFFPPGTDQAFYVVTVQMSVRRMAEIPAAETQLASALGLLAYAWAFAGGTMLLVHERTTIQGPRFETNIDEVRELLMATDSGTRITASSTSSYESVAGYRAPPLPLAGAIAVAMRTNAGLQQLLRYYYHAWVDYFGTRDGLRASWFVDLYKVRDLIKRLHSEEASAQRELQISAADWQFFGRALNNGDLRHGSLIEVARLDASVVHRLFDVARSWIAAHLRFAGLTVC